MHIRYNKIQHLYIIAVCFSLIHCADKPKKNMNLLGSKSIPFDLPPHIKQITSFGQRAEWSHDGERILFIEKNFILMINLLIRAAYGAVIIYRDFCSMHAWYRGFFDYRRTDEDYHEGFQSVPVDWSISSERKSFFNKLKETTGY
ncbi:hypothetical protein ES708_17794 [subsurface metagenome]